MAREGDEGMSLIVPDSLMALAHEVASKRRELAQRYAQLCALNGELRANGGVAFSEPNADGWCVSYRVNPNVAAVARGVCAAADRARTTPPGATAAPAELTARIEQAYAAWQAAVGAAEDARLFFEASGSSFLEEILAKANG
jgi:hypothetical protein